MAKSESWIGIRQLLRRLRDAMAGHGTAQERLDKIVQLIARGMVAEVCSVYVLRPGDTLVLFATQGLRRDAVHRTRLRVGEGLVGEIAARARPLALSDAQSHRNFAYRPETGEEIYHSLLGVPILRGGRVRGVLVVQNQTLRQYTEEEIETLETVAMLVAELVAGGELLGRDELGSADSSGLLPMRMQGIRLSGGQAIGEAVLHRRGAAITHVVAEDPETEIQRLAEALAAMRSHLDTMLETYSGPDGAEEGEHVDILRSIRMIAEDRGWFGRIREAIRGGLTAEAAVGKVQNDTRARAAQVKDPYFRERLFELDDLAFRLLQHLSGSAAGKPATMPDSPILFARELGPAELLDYGQKLKAVVLEEASATSHVAVVARALGLPVIGGVKDVMRRVEPGDPVLVDAENGLVAIRPSEGVRQAFREALAIRQARQRAFAASRDLPAETTDGVGITLSLNAGMLVDMAHVKETGAAGVGLFRTEIAFMIRSGFPSVTSQQEMYTRVLDLAGDRPVLFRTLDVGGDKVLPYFRIDDENPALGWRALRIALDRPAMLRQQLRAMIRAADGRNLHLMFPMVAEVAEFDAARTILDAELAREAARGVRPAGLKVGTMLEVPALMFQLPSLLQRIDFLSVGSNDLVQFLFASDRGNPRVSERYDTLSPAVLEVLRQVREQADAAGVPLGVCGEMAGNTLDAMALVGLGYRNLSMTPTSIGPVRTMIRSLDLAALERYLASLRGRSDHSLRRRLRAFAQDHNVAI